MGRKPHQEGEKEETKCRRRWKKGEGFFLPCLLSICCCGAGKASGAKKGGGNMYYEKTNNTGRTRRKNQTLRMDPRAKEGKLIKVKVSFSKTI